MNAKSDTVDPVDILPSKEAFSAGAYMIAGRGLAFLASLAVVTVMGTSIPREIAGSYTFVMATLTILSIATLPGMNGALSRAVAQGYEGSIRTIIRLRIRWGLVGSAGSLAIAAYYFLHGNMTLGFVFLVATPFIPLTDTFSSLTFAYWQGKKRFVNSALATTTYYCMLAALSVPIFLLTDNLLLIVLGILSSQAMAGFLVYQSVARRTGTIPASPSVKLGFHLTAMQAMHIFAGNIDRVIVWSLLGPAMTAVYTFASLPIMKAWQLVPIGIVSLPHLSTHTFTRQVKRTVIKKTFMLFAFTIPATIIGIILAPAIYRIFFPLYPDSVRYFQLLAVPLVFSPVLLLKSALTAFHKTRTLYVTEIANPILKITLMVVGGIAFGLEGIAYAAIISTCSDFIITCILFARSRTNE